MTIELFTAFYGDSHLELFHNSLLPSLGLSTNVPALSALGHKIEHRVYCTSNESSRVTGALVDDAILRSDLHPDDNRKRLYLCFQDAIKRGNLVVVAQADHVFGHGLARALEGIQPGEVLVCGHPRIDVDALPAALPEALSSDTDNHQFVRFCMDRIPHPMVTHGKTNPEPYWRTVRKHDHWETYFKEPPPLAFWGSPEMLDSWTGSKHGSLEVIDHELVDDALRRGKLKWISDSRTFLWAECTNPRYYIPTIYNDIWLDSCKHFDRTPLRWYF